MKITRENCYRIGAIALLAVGFSVNAETRIDQVWTCTLNEGHTIEELQAVHSKWIAWANKLPQGAGISGAVAQSMVSSAFAVFIIDSYPNMAALSADWAAYESSEEGQALNAEYDEVSTCTSNALYSVNNLGAE